ncbi:alkyl sulfatase dimerization domain-containing protein [Streptomyces sp. BPSDS2]|uniref:alkyl/aryl-sulfatase n=1 Tax=Streptomyces sp. BPSDS2 TaxID=2571021 RepID=UPI001F112D34|nr:alkyl sulfatase dimerization domain-containing protein [Streptomyces sp. BPSDS2]
MRKNDQPSHDIADDGLDAQDADRGFIAALRPGVVKDASGRVVWDSDAYAFLLEGDPAPTVHPALWRQAALCARQGLYEVTEGVYQVRGLDLSNITFVEGQQGVVVVDPLISAEVAAAALALYRSERGSRPVTAVVYTHPHFDHFGGVMGIIEPDDGTPVIAPEHFMEHAVSENVYAGTAMVRRGMYFGGYGIPVGPEGQVNTGLGMAGSAGSVGLIPPTLEITATGQEEVLDGVRFIFQMTPGTEAPAEMNFFLPERRALCMAENTCHTLHNLLTLRGAQVRDARAWSRYINEAIELYTDEADVVFASHHWPVWGRERILRFLSQQRDMYGYLHDQTLRMMNTGLTGSEIAEEIEIPPALEAAWHVRGYYGSVSHNVKAIYQRYMGWFDGNPAHLWQHPPQAQGQRYVRALGGAGRALEQIRLFADEGDLRFAAELASHLVFADPENQDAKEALAGVLTRLGHGAENATWRNFYLQGAHELRNPIAETAIALAASMASALSVTQAFDSLAIRVNGPRAWAEELSILWRITDVAETHRTVLSNGVLIHYEDPKDTTADLSLTLTKAQLLGLLATGSLPDAVERDGDAGALVRLMSVLDAPDASFPIVTP